MNLPIDIDMDQFVAFCQRWKIKEFAFFGSVLRGEFGADSDIDVLVDFAPDADWSLLDHVRMEEELAEALGRDVDIQTRRAVQRSPNWLRRQSILESAEVVYATR
jgi:predicted nucleotidyltransferase